MRIEFTGYTVRLAFKTGGEFVANRYIEFEEVEDLQDFLKTISDSKMLNDSDFITVTGQLQHETLNGGVDHDNEIIILNVHAFNLAECLKPL